MPTVNDTVFRVTQTITVPYATDRFYLNKYRVENGWLVFAQDTLALYLIKDVDELDNTTGYTNLSAGGGGGGGTWGEITGTLSSQIDLSNALNTKVDEQGGTLVDGTLSGTTIAETIDADSITVQTIPLSATISTDDQAVGITLTGRNFGATVAQWESVLLGPSGTWILADADGTGTYPAQGLAVASGTSGNAATILTQGHARNDAWNWTPGGAIYISTTAGGLTQTAPSTSGNIVQPVGVAETADIAYFHFNQTYGEVA